MAPSDAPRCTRCLILLSLLAGCAVDDAPPADLGLADTAMAGDGIYTLETRYGVEQFVWEDRDGLAVIEGDIVVGHADVLRRDHRSHIYSELDGLWENSTVPYVIHSGFVDDSRVYDAIGHWEQYTALRFTPRTTEADYVEFVDGNGCYSYLGRIGGKQEITLDAGCTVGNAIHEIGHAAGLWHEHNRPDRDDHIDVLEDCIIGAYAYAYEKRTTFSLAHGVYDRGSIMHYGSDYFLDSSATAPDGGPCVGTMFSLQGEWIPAQRDALSDGDIDAIEDMYGSAATPLQITMLSEPEPGTGTLRVYSAVPGEEIWFMASYAGIGDGPCFPRLGGMCLDLVDPVRVLGVSVADELGIAERTYGVRPGQDVSSFAVQAVARRGLLGGQSVTSNATDWATVSAPSCGSPLDVHDCSGVCYPEAWIGDGYCDDGLLYPWGAPDFYCAEFGWDDGDC